MTPSYWNDATRELSGRDPVLRILIRNHEGPYLQSRGDAFTTLARSIVGQQISVSAAESVWQKLLESVGSLGPAAIVRMEPSRLRACGLSSKKSTHLVDLAEHFLDGSLQTADWSDHDDEQLIAELTRVKGVGRWTAEMFLIFGLGRADVFPIDDLGLIKGIHRHYNNGERMTKAELLAIGESWRPYRSLGTWYMWRVLDPVAVAY